MKNVRAATLVAQLLSSEEVKLVSGGGDPPHSQNGSSYSQDGTCPSGYVQMGNAGSYSQTCKPTPTGA
ncbi:MAG: hypothetical protein ACQR33_05360 [Candidatus Saccharibacteria bacterium]